MQIDALVLYNHEGEMRTIRFKPGRLNIITGESGTGKSSIIGILRFLLGGDSPNVPIGPIQDTVRWYGLLAHVGNTRFFVGRPAPAHGATTSKAFFSAGATEAPPFSVLENNATSSDVIERIGSLIGISENQHIPPATQTRRPLSANLKHALYYCFQGQGEIANPDLLFHHQNLDFHKQAIRDTLPYFLGAQDPDILRKRQELAEIRHKLRRTRSKLEEAQTARRLGIEQAIGLIENARASGLMSSNIVPQDTGQAVEILSGLLVAEESPDSVDDADLDGEIEQLISSRSALRDELRSLNEKIRGLDEYARVGADYSGELDEHRVRLASIGLISDQEKESKCPVCNTALSSSSARSNIFRHLEIVSHRIESAHRDIPRINQKREELLESRKKIRAELSSVSAALEGLVKTDELREVMRKSWQQQSYVRGRISQYLETVNLADDHTLSKLEREVRDLEQCSSRLSEELNSEGVRSKVYSMLNVVSRRMTELAQSFPLEHSEIGVGIDPYRLTVVAATPKGPAYMDAGAIGSGMSWVGYHLTAYLALQDYFINADRPVPRFIFFDQASQAFFPPDRPVDGDVFKLSDADRVNTLKLYEMMYSSVLRLKGSLQIIAVDHADFPDWWFSDSVIEVWRGGKALIPGSWIR